MRIEHTLSNGLKHEFEITIPAPILAAAFNLRVDNLSKTVKIPGFRPGKVPLNVIQARFGKEARQEIAERSQRQAIENLIVEKKFRLATEPVVKTLHLKENEDFKFIVGFEIMPTIALKDFAQIKLEKLIPILNDSHVDRSIQAIAKRHKKFEDLDNNEKAKKGDLVNFELTMTMDKQVLKGMKKIKGNLILGDNQFPFLEVETGLVGVKNNQEISLSCIPPEGFEDEEVVGKEIQCEFKILSVQRPIVFSVDEKLAQEFQCNTLDELHNKVLNDLKNSFGFFSYLHTKRHLLDALNDEYTFDLPPSLVDNELKQIWGFLEKEIEQAESREDVLGEEDAKKTDGELKKQYRTIAERRVRLGLLMNHIIEVNKLQASEEEMRQAFYNQIMQNPTQAESIMALYKENPELMQRLAVPILEEKAIQSILEKATLTEIAVGPEELKERLEDVVPVAFDFDEISDEEVVKANKSAKDAKAKKEESKESAPAKKAAPAKSKDDSADKPKKAAKSKKGE
jgi:trigger factor